MCRAREKKKYIEQQPSMTLRRGRHWARVKLNVSQIKLCAFAYHNSAASGRAGKTVKLLQLPFSLN
jgi:hypothetical protein